MIISPVLIVILSIFRLSFLFFLKLMFFVLSFLCNNFLWLLYYVLVMLSVLCCYLLCYQFYVTMFYVILSIIFMLPFLVSVHISWCNYYFIIYNL